MLAGRVLRSRARNLFSRVFRGTIYLTTYLRRRYRIGDYVDIEINGASHKGMPHKFYHGRTGQLGQQCEEIICLRYVYYYSTGIFPDTGSKGLSPGGGIPTPNWDAIAYIEAVKGVTEADVVSRMVDRFSSEASNTFKFHARRWQALKALTYAPSSNNEMLFKLDRIVFGILDKRQMLLGKTWNGCRWFSSGTLSTDGVSATVDVASNALSNDAINIKFQDIMCPKAFASYFKQGKLYYIPCSMPSSRFQNLFFQHFQEELEKWKLLWQNSTGAARNAKSQYISIKDFLWWYLRIPDKHKWLIYEHMIETGISVMESCPETALEDPVVVCIWCRPPVGWLKLNVSGYFNEHPGGRTDAGHGEILRNSSGHILEFFHRTCNGVTSREELFLVGVLHGLKGVLNRKSKVKSLKSRLELENLILEIDNPRIVRVLNLREHVPKEYRALYSEISDLLSKFKKHQVEFLHTRGNGSANRVAFLAAQLKVGQSFPWNEDGLAKELMKDRLKIPRHVLAFKKKN